jgi:hypothetical protein
MFPLQKLGFNADQSKCIQNDTSNPLHINCLRYKYMLDFKETTTTTFLRSSVVSRPSRRSQIID